MRRILREKEDKDKDEKATNEEDEEEDEEEAQKNRYEIYVIYQYIQNPAPDHQRTTKKTSFDNRQLYTDIGYVCRSL